MSELEVLRRVEQISRNMKLNVRGLLSDTAQIAPSMHRGRQQEARVLLMARLSDLEAAFVELDLMRAGMRASS